MGANVFRELETTANLVQVSSRFQAGFKLALKWEAWFQARFQAGFKPVSSLETNAVAGEWFQARVQAGFENADAQAARPCGTPGPWQKRRA